MNKLWIVGGAVALGVLSAQAWTAERTGSERRAERAAIEARHRVFLEECRLLTGNTREICLADAKGKTAVAKAELELEVKPGARGRYGVSRALAEADYGTAIERCDDREGPERAVCIKEVSAVKAEADATAQVLLEMTGSGERRPAKASRNALPRTAARP